jgi:hypothetical protein
MNKKRDINSLFLCSQIFGLEIDEIMKYFFITNKQMEELEKNNTEEKKRR